MAYLVVKVDSEEVCRQELKNDEPVTIGRALDCTLWLANPKLSRTHCKIQPDDGRWVLVDLNSRNGVIMDGMRIDQHVLSDGDTFELDNAKITYRDGPLVPKRAAAPAPGAGPTIPADLLPSTTPESSSSTAEKDRDRDGRSGSSLYATRAVVQTKAVIQRPHVDSTLTGHKPLAFTRPPAKPIVEPENENPAAAPQPRDPTKWLMIGGIAIAVMLIIAIVWGIAG